MSEYVVSGYWIPGYAEGDSDAAQFWAEKPVVRMAYFAEFQFASGTQRLSNFNITINWGGYDWLGLGSLGSISEVEESDGLEARPLNFSLCTPSELAVAIGPVEEYRGRPAKLYRCPLDEQFRLVGTPELCWRGTMDMMSVGISGEAAQIVLKCETSAYGLKRPASLRMNAAQQKKRYPLDTGFDYLTDLIANPQLWLSKKFQSI